jgi:competence protein ComEC
MGQRPLLAASAAFLAGAYLGCIPSISALLALGAGLLAVWRPVRPAAIGLALGLLRGALHEQPPAFEPPSEAMEIEARIISADGVVRLREGLALLHIRPELQVHRGDRVLLWARLHRPPGKLNPGGRDRREALALRGIAIEGSAEVIAILERGPALWRLLDELRARFSARARAVCSSSDRAALVAALAVADRSGLSAEAEDELSASGLVHLLASSGLHLAVVTLLLRFVGARLWLRTRWAASVRASAAGAALALPFAVLEVLLLGAPWPAVRAGFGAAHTLAGSALARRRDGLTALALGASACALFDPAATHDLALQLSVAGITGLLVLARPLREMLPIALPPLGASLLRRAPEHMLRLGCATAAASLFTAPLLAAAFHRVSLVSAVANALALLPGLAAIPIATALVVVDALPLWFVADGLAGFTLAAAEGFASLPFATLLLAAPGILATMVWYAGVLAFSRRAFRPALLAAALLAISAAARAWPEEKMRITFLAVGQGDAAIVQFPGRGAMLVDAGGDLRWPGRFDPGARDVIPALAELGVPRLDLVVLTHPHPDHAGGLLTVLRRVPVGELWMTRDPDPIAAQIRAQAHVPIREPHDTEISGVRIEVHSHYDPSRSINDNSMVLRLVHGEIAVLLAGDVEALAESELAQHQIKAVLLKAPHPGSRTSSTDAFLRRVAPKWVVYSAGKGNAFGFPNPDVIERTRALGAQTCSTESGAIFAESDGKVLVTSCSR